ncbi:MAG: hypothetical protein ACXWAT_11080, partial [Methylobacter sp.]
MKQLIIIVLTAIALSACTSTGVSKSLASGVIGCPSQNIKITEETASVRGTHEWIAECNGKLYVCSYVYGSNTNCTEKKDKVVSAADDCLARQRYNSM